MPRPDDPGWCSTVRQRIQKKFPEFLVLGHQSSQEGSRSKYRRVGSLEFSEMRVTRHQEVSIGGPRQSHEVVIARIRGQALTRFRIGLKRD